MAKVRVSYLANILNRKVKPIYSEVEGNTITECTLTFAKKHRLQNELYHNELFIHLNNKLVHVNDWKTTLVKENDVIEVKPVVGVSAGVILTAIYWGVTGISVAALATGAYYAAKTLNNYIKGLIPDVEVPDFNYNEQTPNYSWSGAGTLAQEGIPIPVIYGKHCTGGNVISESLRYENGHTALDLLLALGEATLGGVDTSSENFCVNDKPCTEIDNFTTLFTGTFFPDGIPASYFDGSNSIGIINIGNITQVQTELANNTGWTAFFNPKERFENYCHDLDNLYWSGGGDWDVSYEGSAWLAGREEYPNYSGYLTYNWDSGVIHSQITRSNLNLNFTLTGYKAILFFRYHYVYTEDDGSHSAGDRYAGTAGTGWGEYGTDYRYWTNAYAVFHRDPWSYFDGDGDGGWPWGGWDDDWDHSKIRFAEFVSDTIFYTNGHDFTNGGWDWAEPHRTYPGLYVVEGLSGWDAGTILAAHNHRLYENTTTNISVPFTCPSAATGDDPFTGLPSNASVKIEIIRMDDWNFTLSLDNVSSSVVNTNGYNQLSMVYLQFSNASEFLSGTIPTFKMPVTGLSTIKQWTMVNGVVTYLGKSWTDNPVWCLVDLLTHKRYGFGEYITISDIDLTTACITAKKCDLLHFRLNIILDSSIDLPAAIDTILESFGGMLTISLDGKIKILIDHLEQYPIQSFTRSDILQGSLISSFSSLKGAPNALELRFPDYKNHWNQKVLYLDVSNLYNDTNVWDGWTGTPPSLDQVRLDTINLRGTTDTSNAAAIGCYKLAKATRNSQAVSFRVRPSAIRCEPGDIVLLQDVLINSQYGGRIVDVNYNSSLSRLYVYLDQEVALPISTSWYLYLTFIGDLSVNGTLDSSSVYNTYWAPVAITDTSSTLTRVLTFDGTNATMLLEGLTSFHLIGLDSSGSTSSYNNCRLKDPNNNINYIIGSMTTL